ncbi:hypothetical protein F383_02839 [Gossypium arboreum]|uniref:Uncharacterized protein n=1 Tax=Gossypium arboreum TaxID=29729 RepID=A0A0B0PKH5_GOSAR|nr:hypothetical protein F383_02839 [Gossypium arboreum]
MSLETHCEFNQCVFPLKFRNPRCELRVHR